MRLKYFIGFGIVALVLGVFSGSQFVYGASYTKCLGSLSNKISCVDETKKNEEYSDKALWIDCVGEYDSYQTCTKSLEEDAVAAGEILYNLCYDITNQSDAQCITYDYSWVSEGKPISGYGCVTGWVEKSKCEAKLAVFIQQQKSEQTIICCFPPKSEQKDIACAEITANYSNTKEVDTKCANALGGDDNYAQKANDKCSKYSECKSTGAKKKSSSGGAAGTTGGAGVSPTKTKVGGGNFEIGSLTDPFGSYTVPTLIGTIIKSLLSIVGTIALVLFVYAGIMWMTAAGNEERTRSSAKIMMWTVLGLVVIFASYILVTFVFSALQ